MGSVSAQEHAALAKNIGNEPAAIPVFARDHLVAQIRSGAEDLADGPIPVDGFEIRLVVAQIVVNEPGLAPVDRIDAATSTGVEREIDP